MESTLCTSCFPVTGAHASPTTARHHLGLTLMARHCRIRGKPHRLLAARVEMPMPEPPVPAEGGDGRGGMLRLPSTAVRVGVSLALALALGGMSWSRGGGAGAGMQPMVHLNAIADTVPRPSERGATAMQTTLAVLSESLFRRDDAPKDRFSVMDLVYEQVTKEESDRGKLMSLLHKEWSASRDSERKLNLGLLLTQVLINQREFQKAKEVCQQLTGRSQRDSRPYLHLAVINMMMAVETMLSPDTASTDDIEKMSKNAMDAWKEFKNKYELSKGTAEAST